MTDSKDWSAAIHDHYGEQLHKLQEEVERLRAENEALLAERDNLRSEVERLDACRKAHLLQANDSLHEVAELIHDNEEFVKAANIEAMENDRLRSENEAKQARIDALMLEFCPDEMTSKQIVEWEHHQVGARGKSLTDMSLKDRVAAVLEQYETCQNPTFFTDVMAQIIREMQAEMERYQADAERYRKIFKSAGTDAAIDHIIRQTQIVSQS